MRPCGPVAPRDDAKTSAPIRFDVFVAALNMREIGVENWTKSVHRSKRTGDFGAACEEAARQRLQTQKHRPWELYSEVLWPVGAEHARAPISRSAVQPLRLLGPLTALAGASAEEAHGAIFYIQGAHLAPHEVRLVWPIQVCQRASGTHFTTHRPLAPLVATEGTSQPH